MKKIILASAATLLISMFAGCIAADDSTISSPRHSDLTKIPKGSPVTQTGIAELCKSYTTEGMRNGVTVYQCSDNDKFYGCDETRCQEMSEEAVEEFLEDI